jgi:hypothetical protein
LVQWLSEAKCRAIHSALVQPAVREQVLKLAAIGGFGALAFLVQAFEDFVSLAAAVFLAGTRATGVETI